MDIKTTERLARDETPGGGGSPPPPGRLRLEVPIPGKPSVVVMVPDDMDAEDWSMLNTMMTTYIERWKKLKALATLPPQPAPDACPDNPGSPLSSQ